MRKNYFFKIIFIISAIIFVIVPKIVLSDETSDIKAKIEQKNQQIKQLEEEIRQYNIGVEAAQNQAKTLQNTIKTLDLTQKKINTDINLTNTKINKTNLTINQTLSEIDQTKNTIEQNKKALSNLLKQIKMFEDSNDLVFFLSQKNINEIWTDMDSIIKVQGQIKLKSDELRVLRSGLETKKVTLDNQKKELSDLKQDLNGKKQVVVETKKEKANLLTETKNKEQTFKQLVKSKEELKAQFEQDLYDFESQLNILIDKSKYVGYKKGTLSWPLDNVYITQKFGKTVGAEKLYVSGSHNGVDFRASVGTKVKAVLDGVIVGTGNTDQYSGCYSFGKWVMIKHLNGLSTIYGHLSVINVSKDQEVKTGDIIGYSGNTGYSTGPHLHLGVYATQGVRIEKFTNSKGCKQAIIPLADTKAYLDPMEYLPEL